MDFSNFLRENSLFTGAGVRTQLVDDIESVMDSLVFNYFGYLGLVKLNNKAGYLRTYQKNDKSIVNMNGISDDSNDVGLVVKLAFEADAIKYATATKMIKLLMLIQQKKINSDNFDEGLVRSLLDEIKYSTNKPSARVLQLLKDFHSGAISISIFTKKLYTLARMKDYSSSTTEFRDLVIKGKFNTLFNDLTDTNLNSPNTATVVGAATPVNVKPVTKEVPKAKELDEFFFKKIFSIVSEDAFIAFLSKYDLDKNTLFKKHRLKLSAWLSANLTNQSAPIELDQAPLFKDNPDGLRLLATIINNEIKTFAEHKDPDGFIERLKFFDSKAELYLRIGFSFFITGDASPAWRYCRELTKAFYEKRVDSCPYNRQDIYKLDGDAKRLFDGLFKYTAITSNEYEYEDQFIGDKFNKRMAIGLVSRILDKRKLVGTYKKDLSRYIENAFGSGSSLGKKDELEVTKMAYSKADPNLQAAYDIVVQYKMGQIIDESDIIGAWANTIKNLTLNLIYRPNTMIVPDLSKISDGDIKKVADQLEASMSDLDLIGRMEMLISYPELNSSFGLVKTWFVKSMKLVLELADRGHVLEKPMFFRLAMNDRTAEDALEILERNINLYKNMLGDIDLSQITTYIVKTPYRSWENITKFLTWISKLQNSNKISLKNSTFYKLFDGHAIMGTRIPFMKINDFRLLDDFLTYGEEPYNDKAYFNDYMNWLIANQPEILKLFIKIHETEVFIKNSQTLKYIAEKDVTDKIIQNYLKNRWPVMGADVLTKEVEYYNSKKMRDALVKFVLDTKKDLARDLNYKAPILPLLSAEKFNKEIKDLTTGVDASEAIIKMASWNPRDLTILFDRISKNQDLIENIDTEVFKILMQVGNSRLGLVTGDVRDRLAELARRVKINDESKIDAALPKLATKMKTVLVQYLVGSELGMSASKEIFRDDVPIKPYTKLDENRIVEILKYNNIGPDDKMAAKAKTSDDINKMILEFSNNLHDVKAVPVKESPEYFERKTVEYDVFNKYLHGQIAPKILREFNVNLPEQSKEFYGFVATNPSTTIMDPVFHGTGSIAASMILRYGFAIISANDSLVVARMLGNGIYFSNVIDKVSQYVADDGFTRGVGTKGYIFRMKAALGEKNKDYKDGKDVRGKKLVSPEWAVFQPNKQLLIYKAFEVEIVTRDEIESLKKKHNINEETSVEIMTFKEFIRESESGLFKHATTYSFVDGNIPISAEESVPFEDFVPGNFGSHVRLEYSQLGPMVTIEHNGPASQAFCVRYTEEFMAQKELKDFLNLLSGHV